ncbi:MAG: hypothetical protein HYT16_01255 [DPANN group archaeon]|nr:hypothetical protein [DPANN group archaeon]
MIDVDDPHILEKLEPVERFSKAIKHRVRSYIIHQLGRRGRPSTEIIKKAMQQGNYSRQSIQGHLDSLRMQGVIVPPGKGKIGYSLTDYGCQFVYPSLLRMRIRCVGFKAAEQAKAAAIGTFTPPEILDALEQHAYRLEVLNQRANRARSADALEGILAQCAEA